MIGEEWRALTVEERAILERMIIAVDFSGQSAATKQLDHCLVQFRDGWLDFKIDESAPPIPILDAPNSPFSEARVRRNDRAVDLLLWLRGTDLGTLEVVAHVGPGWPLPPLEELEFG